MLILSRKLNETIVIGEDVRITVVSVVGNQIRLGIEAPRDIAVHRAEVKDKIDAMRQICERDHEGENEVEVVRRLAFERDRLRDGLKVIAEHSVCCDARHCAERVLRGEPAEISNDYTT